MKLIKQVRCSGKWKDWNDVERPCAETNPNKMILCSATQLNGCKLYFCYMCWGDHIKECPPMAKDDDLQKGTEKIIEKHGGEKVGDKKYDMTKEVEKEKEKGGPKGE